MVPACCQCKWNRVSCLKKTCGPGCQRCAGHKVKCSAVDEQRKKKEMEIEKEKMVKVKRLRRVEGSENGDGEKMEVLKRIAEALEGMLAGQQEIIGVRGHNLWPPTLEYSRIRTPNELCHCKTPYVPPHRR